MAKKPKQTTKNDWPVKAYNNLDFLHSPAARPLRILSEMLEPADRLRRHHIRNTVVFFGSARSKPMSETRKTLKTIEKKIRTSKTSIKKLQKDLEVAEHDVLMSKYYEDAVKLSEKLTKWFQAPQNSKHKFVICSGGGPGMMEAANKGAKKAKGESIGLNINIPNEQYANHYLTKEISFEFHYFFIRKFWFFYLSKAMIVFPGGFGTLDELFELLTLIQTEKTKKYMPVILYGGEYWRELINFDLMVKWGTISKSDLKLFKICNDIDEVFTYLKKELIKNYSLKA